MSPPRNLGLFAALFTFGCTGTSSETVISGDSTTSGETDVFSSDGSTGFTPDAGGFEAYVEPDTGPAWDARFGDAPATEPGCLTCFNSYCKGLYDICYHEDPVCPDQVSCRLGCVDEACAKRCREMYPSTNYDDYLACMAKHCSDACGL